MAKKGIETKEESFASLNNYMQSELELPESLKEHLEAEGLAARWINKKQYKEKGMHRMRWKPYKIPSEISVGQDSEGYLSRGDLVLGAKTDEELAKHKALLRAKNERYKAFQKTHAQELKRGLESSGIKTKVETGYDD